MKRIQPLATWLQRYSIVILAALFFVPLTFGPVLAAQSSGAAPNDGLATFIGTVIGTAIATIFAQRAFNKAKDTKRVTDDNTVLIIRLTNQMTAMEQQVSKLQTDLKATMAERDQAREDLRKQAEKAQAEAMSAAKEMERLRDELEGERALTAAQERNIRDLEKQYQAMEGTIASVLTRLDQQDAFAGGIQRMNMLLDHLNTRLGSLTLTAQSEAVAT